VSRAQALEAQPVPLAALAQRAQVGDGPVAAVGGQIGWVVQLNAAQAQLRSVCGDPLVVLVDMAHRQSDHHVSLSSG
jgi:hypothetical protein